MTANDHFRAKLFLLRSLRPDKFIYYEPRDQYRWTLNSGDYHKIEFSASCKKYGKDEALVRIRDKANDYVKQRLDELPNDFTYIDNKDKHELRWRCTDIAKQGKRKELSVKYKKIGIAKATDKLRAKVEAYVNT